MQSENDEASQAPWERDPIIEPARPAARPQGLELGAGKPAPAVLQASGGPQSSGYFPLVRRFSIGDRATFVDRDGYTGAVRNEARWRVTRVDEIADRVEVNNGNVILDLMGNVRRTPIAEFDIPPQFTPTELFVGKRWTAAFRNKRNGETRHVSFDFRIRKRERIVVPAGEFNAFRLEGAGVVLEESGTSPGSTQGFSGVGSYQATIWLLPGANFLIKHEHIVRGPAPRSEVRDWNVRELVDLKQEVLFAPA